jgi:4-coumarate--CoA ligase
LLDQPFRAKVVNTAGKPVGFGEIGELWSRSPSNALGYLANQKATDETFDSEGFLHTGDEVYFSKEGWLFVVDRIKELIKVSGNQVRAFFSPSLFALLAHNIVAVSWD